MADKKNENEKVFYGKQIFKRGKDQPLNEATLVVTAEPSFVEKKSGQYGDYIAVNATAILGDKFVERNFGAEFVNPEHKVDIRFNLSGQNAQNFVEHTPRWGQEIAFMLYDLKVEEFKRRNGDTGRNLSAKCAGYMVFGSTKKNDGSDRPLIKIRGAEGAAPAGGKTAGPTISDLDVAQLHDEDENDEDLPF